MVDTEFEGGSGHAIIYTMLKFTQIGKNELFKIA